MDLSRGTLAGRVPWTRPGARSVLASVLAAGLLVGATTGITAAQDPSASPAGGPVTTTSPSPLAGSLYLQTYATSLITPDGDELVVQLRQATGQTMYIGELPERRVGTLPSTNFLARLEVSLGVPPYAGVLGERADGSQVFVVGQVLSGAPLDRQTVEYRLRPIDDAVDIDLVVDAERLAEITEPLELGLSYILFTGVEGCPPPQTVC